MTRTLGQIIIVFSFLIYSSCNEESVEPSPSLKKGCTDPLSLNYDSLAVIEDSSCSYLYGGRENVRLILFIPSADTINLESGLEVCIDDKNVVEGKILGNLSSKISLADLQNLNPCDSNISSNDSIVVIDLAFKSNYKISFRVIDQNRAWTQIIAIDDPQQCKILELSTVKDFSEIPLTDYCKPENESIRAYFYFNFNVDMYWSCISLDNTTWTALPIRIEWIDETTKDTTTRFTTELCSWEIYGFCDSQLKFPGYKDHLYSYKVVTDLGCETKRLNFSFYSNSTIGNRYMLIPVRQSDF